MRILPVKEFRRFDLNSEEMGVPVATLMANAGAALGSEANAMAPSGPILVLCGKGNNGGDGYAAAALLQQKGRDVTVIEVAPPSGTESKAAQARCLQQSLHDWGTFDRAMRPSLVVDCVLGSGIAGEPRGDAADAIAWINEAHAGDVLVLSCDVPSGFPSSLRVTPDVTVTFHAAKEGMDEGTCGRIVVTDIGIPPEAEQRIGFGDLSVGYPIAKGGSHKGDNGRVLVVAGGPFTGAPYYAAVGAYRTGADLVQAYMPVETATAVRNYGPEPIVHDAGPGRHLGPAGVGPILDALPNADVLLIGPGLGTHRETLEAVGRILQEAGQRRMHVVIDADGLDGVPDDYWAENGPRTIVTPHRQEFADLTGTPASPDAARAWSLETGAVVVLKGAIDWVACGDRVRECHRGHPTMTVGGTGDVLAGAIAAILARGASPCDAACAGAYLLGVAGERAAKELGAGAVALDIADHIPGVLALLEQADA